MKCSNLFFVYMCVTCAVGHLCRHTGRQCRGVTAPPFCFLLTLGMKPVAVTNSATFPLDCRTAQHEGAQHHLHGFHMRHKRASSKPLWMSKPSLTFLQVSACAASRLAKPSLTFECHWQTFIRPLWVVDSQRGVHPWQISSCIRPLS